VLAVIRRKDACKLQLKSIRFYKAPFIKMLRIGVPAGIQSSLFSISNVLIQSSINSFGDVFMAGNAAASNIESFIYVAMNAFHQTAVNFAGQNAGAMKYRRVFKTFGICLVCAGVVGFVFGQIVYGFGPQLLSIYITDSQVAIQHGMVRFAYIAAPYFLCGLMDVATGVLRGVGASTTPMLISVLGICGLRIIWIYTVFQIPAYHTPECLYLSYVITWVVTFIAETIAFLLICKKRIQNKRASATT
jgi:Na+-driven multidrug efflux pump